MVAINCEREHVGCVSVCMSGMCMRVVSHKHARTHIYNYIGLTTCCLKLLSYDLLVPPRAHRAAAFGGLMHPSYRTTKLTVFERQGHIK